MFGRSPKEGEQSTVLVASANEKLRRQLSKFVEKAGAKPIPAENGAMAMSAARTQPVDLILVEQVLPDMAGLTVCARLHENIATAYIPVILLVTHGDVPRRSEMLQAGVDDHLRQPLDKKDALAKIELGLQWSAHWKEFQKMHEPKDPAGEEDVFRDFKHFLCQRLGLDDFTRAHLVGAAPAAFYTVCARLKIGSHHAAELMAEFLHLPYSDQADAEDVIIGSLPQHLCRAYGILTVNDPAGPIVLHANPFLPRFDEVTVILQEKYPGCRFHLCDPNIIALLFQGPEYEEKF
jgi:CheY-like chemotaxis protein